MLNKKVNIKWIIRAHTGPKFCVANLLSFLQLFLSIDLLLLLITTIKMNGFFQALNSYWYFFMRPSCFLNIDKNKNTHHVITKYLFITQH